MTVGGEIIVLSAPLEKSIRQVVQGDAFLEIKQGDMLLVKIIFNRFMVCPQQIGRTVECGEFLLFKFKIQQISQSTLLLQPVMC
jgi:hypothetical protein